MGRNYSLKVPQIKEAEILYKAHKSMDEIAQIFGVSVTAVRNALELQKVNIRSRRARQPWTLDRMRIGCAIDKKTECWNWTGCTQGNGYGRIRFDGKTVYAHRMAYFLHYGKWPTHLACHVCDNRQCCNPEHIVDENHKWNSFDAKNKGRASSGLRHALTVIKHARHRKNTKLDEKKAAAIRYRFSAGERADALAHEFGVSKSNVLLVVNGKAWKQYNNPMAPA